MTEHKLLVGILSGDRKQKGFSGDETFFRNIQDELTTRGGKCFVFTPLGIQEKTIEGFVFENNGWKKKTFPYPSVVYNRLPSQKAEKKLNAFFKRLQQDHIPYFNPRFIDKWEMYERLVNVQKLDIHLPRTEILTDSEKAFTFLKKHSFIYVKPINGKTGNGIVTLMYQDENNIVLKTQSHSKIITSRDVYHFFSTLIRQSQTGFILQQGITLNEWNEQKYDFRILLLKPHIEWKVIGIGVRATNINNITTHTLRGGTILPLDRIRPKVNVKKLTIIVEQIVTELNRLFPTFKECSLDIGRDEDGNFWLFEMNTKPMSFDEQDIERKRIVELVNAFQTVTK
ncbi:YheC/YheD family protein [Pueribacillus sp. YX66]|uniref:YheC/YheD family endospore coat-associated protein n=1 Tax=Pueribacillus sp. YX66 TaxID=3229242 RepID=UPI00358D62FD